MNRRERKRQRRLQRRVEREVRKEQEQAPNRFLPMKLPPGAYISNWDDRSIAGDWPRMQAFDPGEDDDYPSDY